MPSSDKAVGLLRRAVAYLKRMKTSDQELCPLIREIDELLELPVQAVHYIEKRAKSSRRPERERRKRWE
jgi:hypothetical protein